MLPASSARHPGQRRDSATKLLAPAIWGLNIGLAMMVFLSLLPAGIYQAYHSITTGLWFARSPEIVHSTVMEALVWLRVPGDVVFSVGAALLALYALALLRSPGKSALQPAGAPRRSHDMRLTTFTDYSLRMLIYLASAPEKKATIAEVARVYGVSEHHMVKVVHLLGKAGFLKNTRGKGGGVELARPAFEINVGRVVRLTEGEDMPAECFDPSTNTCRITGSCRLQRVLREAVASFHRVLEGSSLEHLVANRAQLLAVLHPATVRRIRRARDVAPLNEVSQ